MRAIKVLLEGPAGPQIVESCGNLAKTVEHALLGNCAGDSLLTREAIRFKLKALRNELVGPNPTPLTRLLAERVALCWLQMHQADAAVLQAGDAGLAQLAYYQRRQSQAQARYLSAIKSLAIVRKLLQPVIVPLMLEAPPAGETQRLAGPRRLLGNTPKEDHEAPD